MVQQISLLLSFDYELFLGVNFMPVSDVLFKPTETILGACAEMDVPVTLFPDVCSAWAHRKYGLLEYVEGFERQLRSAVASGNDVQLHIHPHWLFSEYLDGKWHVNTSRMYLNELGFDASNPHSAPKIIAQGIEYLETLLRPVKPNYECIAFRAAGLALQPDENRLVNSLKECGIKIDTSIAKNLKLALDTIHIDYRNMPSAANWYISESTGISKPSQMGIYEIPIATFQINGMQRLQFLVRRGLGARKMRGLTISRAAKQSHIRSIINLLRANLRYLGAKPWLLLSCDTKGVDATMLLKGLENYALLHDADASIAVAMLNHPKLFFDEQLEIMRRFVDMARERFGRQISFVTYTAVVAQGEGNMGRAGEPRGGDETSAPSTLR